MGQFMRENGKMMKNMGKEDLSVDQELFRLRIYYAEFLFITLKGVFAKKGGIDLRRKIIDSDS